MIPSGPEVEVVWQAHALRALAEDFAPSLMGTMGWLEENPTDHQVERFFKAFQPLARITAEELEEGVRMGESHLDDLPSKSHPGCYHRFFRLKNRPSVRINAVTEKILSRSATHAGTVKVITAYVEKRPLEGAE